MNTYRSGGARVWFLRWAVYNHKSECTRSTEIYQPYFDFSIDGGEVGRLASDGTAVLLSDALLSANNNGFHAFLLRHGDLTDTIQVKRETSCKTVSAYTEQRAGTGTSGIAIHTGQTTTQ